MVLYIPSQTRLRFLTIFRSSVAEANGEPRSFKGFTIIDGTNVDYAKLSECFWRGFDHDEIPPAENIDGNIKCS